MVWICISGIMSLSSWSARSANRRDRYASRLCGPIRCRPTGNSRSPCLYSGVYASPAGKSSGISAHTPSILVAQPAASVCSRLKSERGARFDPAPRPVPSVAAAPASAVDLEQPGAALPAADAHRHHAPFGLAAAAFLQNVPGQACAGHAEGMADRDRTAIDVVFGGIDAELVAAIQALARERLVQLPDVDVVDLQAMALQQFRHGEHRADAHLVRL